MSLRELQRTVVLSDGFDTLDAYADVCSEFLHLLSNVQPTRIVSPTDHNYIFFQFGEEFGHRITRPLNTDLYIEDAKAFDAAFKKFRSLLSALRRKEQRAFGVKRHQRFAQRNGINRVIYTIQQSIGSVGDSFENANQSRKRVGMLFEQLVKRVLIGMGLDCESRTVRIPIAEHPGRSMSYELDLVISRGKAIVASEDSIIRQGEIVGSVKTTSKDRIDKIFLDKFMMGKLLGRAVPVIAVFLHDVQRANRAGSRFAINSTFKSNHFVGYTYALNRLDGVYYVDRRPNMTADQSLAREISGFGRLLTHDMWRLVR